MKSIMDWLKFLSEAGLLTSSFIVGAGAIIIAIIGRLERVLDLTIRRSVLLAVFGVLLFVFAAASNYSRPQSGMDLNHITRAEMDALFGKENWFCFPDREDGLGVKRMPDSFSVVPPLRQVVTYLGEYKVGQFVPAVGATVELEGPLPKTECPLFQLEPLSLWEEAREKDGQPLTQARIDTLVGNSNWQCVDRFPFAVDVARLYTDLPVEYPITFVTNYDSTGFSVGETVPAGGQATVWLSNSIAGAECPQTITVNSGQGEAEPAHVADCATINWEGCWLFDDEARTMTWEGSIDAPFDIGQSGVALTKIRAGYTAVFNINDNAIIEICIGTINDQPVSGICPIFEKIQAGSYQITSFDASGGFRVRSEKSREQALQQYDSIYQRTGWCSTWAEMERDALIKGSCPENVNDIVREKIVNSFGSTQLFITGVQITIQSDIQVLYPACINYGLDDTTVKFSGGQVQPWTPNSNIATNLIVHANSVFSLYFRCDHIPWNKVEGNSDFSSTPALIEAAQTLVVPGYAEDGVRFIAPATGTYQIMIEGGAYSPWPNNTYPGNQGWMTKLFIYKNHAISWGNRESGLVGPIGPDLTLGMGDPIPDRIEAEDVGKGMSVSMHLLANDKLIFVPIDEKGAYDSPENNRGEVRLRISQLSFPFLSEAGIPKGPSMTISVNSNELHAVTSGPICVERICLPGGSDRGSVVILLPQAQYEITGLTPYWNWHGGYYGSADKWNVLATELARQQKIPGTCSDGDGCSIVDVLVVGPKGIVAQYTE